MDSSLNDLLLLLSLKNVNVQEVADDWFNKFPSWEDGVGTFIELLFTCAGWKSFTFDNFKSLSFSSKSCLKEHMSDLPLALDDQFVENFDNFLNFTLNRDFESTVLSSFNALKLIVRAISELRSSRWNTFRLISAHAGLKLLNVIDATNELIRSKLEIVQNCSDKEFTSRMERIQKRLNLLRNQIWQLFLHFLRDSTSEVRVLGYAQMLVLARKDPSTILEEQWHRHIDLGLCDVPHGSEIMLKVVTLLFDPKLNEQLQKALMRTIAEKIVYHMEQKEPSASTAAKILATASRYLDLKWPPNLMLRIHIHVFCPDDELAVNAAEFVYYNLPIDVRQRPDKVLRTLVDFSYQSKLKCPHIVLRSFFGLLEMSVNWHHWMELFAICNAEHMREAALMFISYVKLVTTDAGKFRRPKKLGRATKNELECGKTEFTTFFAAQWVNLFENPKIRLQPPALYAVIASVESVNKSCPSSEASRMIRFLIELLLTYDDARLVKICFTSMTHLQKTVVWSSDERVDIDSQYAAAENRIVADFMEYVNAPVSTVYNDAMEARMTELIKYSLLVDDDLVWSTCCEKLRTTDLKNCDCQWVRALVRVLAGLTMKLYTVLVNELALEAVEDPQVTTSDSTQHNHGILDDRMYQLQSHLLAMINGDIDRSIRVLAFNILVELVRPFGKHLAAIKNDPMTAIFYNRLLPEVEPSLVRFTCETMEWAADSEKCTSEIDRLTAVDVVKKTCGLFKMCFIKFTQVGELLALTGEVQQIDIFVHNVLEYFSSKLPQEYITVAIAIFTGIVKVMEKSMYKQRQMSASASSSSEVVKDVKTVIDRWLLYEDFYKVWGRELVVATVKFMLERFTSRLGIVDLTEWTHSIFLEPPKEREDRIPMIGNDLSTDEEATDGSRAQEASGDSGTTDE